ncbi:flagellar basal body-associated FliL family protein [Novispirillum sp. DQ9]|uniref:flagellar basal body-associated FliL family protein n=1 Tax=Novispirillum sp. DQ9 TaxID=3398612 RepID=UPI003C7E7140
MAEDLDDEYDEEPEGGSKEGGGKKKKLLLLIILPLLLVIGGAAGAYFAGLLDPLLKPSGEEQAAAPAAGAAPAAPGGQPGVMQVQPAVFYDLPEMLVDINAGARKRNFLKLRVSLELGSAADTAAVEAVMPRIIDNFQVYLRELRLEDLQGAGGIYRLREELLVRVNAAVRPAKVNDVLFKEMLVQ